MKLLISIISWVSLGLLILPSIYFLAGRASLDQVKWLMLVATIIWFVTSPFVMLKEKSDPK